MSFVDVEKLREIAEVEFSDMVMDAFVSDINELRIILKDGSFVDVWFSLKLSRRYSFHWERRAIDGKIYRHDNAPHRRWQSVSTFPNHFHDGSKDEVLESNISQVLKRVCDNFLLLSVGKLHRVNLANPVAALPAPGGR